MSEKETSEFKGKKLIIKKSNSFYDKKKTLILDNENQNKISLSKINQILHTSPKNNSKYFTNKNKVQEFYYKNKNIFERKKKISIEKIINMKNRTRNSNNKKLCCEEKTFKTIDNNSQSPRILFILLDRPIFKRKNIINENNNNNKRNKKIINFNKSCKNINNIKKVNTNFLNKEIKNKNIVENNENRNETNTNFNHFQTIRNSDFKIKSNHSNLYNNNNFQNFSSLFSQTLPTINNSIKKINKNFYFPKLIQLNNNNDFEEITCPKGNYKLRNNLFLKLKDLNLNFDKEVENIGKDFITPEKIFLTEKQIKRNFLTPDIKFIEKKSSFKVLENIRFKFGFKNPIEKAIAHKYLKDFHTINNINKL